MQNTPKKIIVHHSGDATKEDQFAKINDYHKSREFPISTLGFYVGYHYLINHEGELTKCREESDEGAHTRGLNFQSIGVCLEGNFNMEQPTQAQKETLGKLLVELCERYFLDVMDIYPHRAFGNTDCYGNTLDNNWARILYLDYKDKVIKEIDQCKTPN